MRRTIWALLLSCLAATSCVDMNTKPTADQRAAASALLASSEQCVKQVRDAGAKYHEAASCVALKHLSMVYIEAGGGRDSASKETELMFAHARMHAWMALAWSASDGRARAIW